MVNRDGIKRHLLFIVVLLVLRCTWDTIEVTPRVQFVSWLVICVLRTKTVFDVFFFKKKKGCAVYLYTARELATFYPCGDGHGMKEFDWAGDRHTRKSASGVALHVQGCVMLVLCRGQLIRARSTAEAEVHAAVLRLK